MERTKLSFKKGGNALPEKKSGKTSKTNSSNNNLGIKNNKNTALKKKATVAKKPKSLVSDVKQKAPKNLPKEKIQEIIKDEINSSETGLIELKEDRPPSRIAEKISSDLEKKNSSHLEPFDEEILFLTDRHQSMISDVISCLKSISPFCFLGSETTNYHEYYKEIVIDHIKLKEKIELLYFDPKFGDDLSVIINKELKGVDISLIGSLNSSISRKILIIDNENFASELDWELIDSLRLELKVVNIGVFGVTPTVLDDKVNPAYNFKSFYLPEIKKSELNELNDYVSKNSYKIKHLETLSSLLMKGPGKDLSGRNVLSEGSIGLWHKLREYIRRR